LSSRTHEPYLRKWSNNLQVPILSVDYTKAPQEQYPFQLKEIYMAYKWLCQHAHEMLGNEPLKNIIIVGDSAGANMALSLVIRLIYENCIYQENIKQNRPVRHVPLRMPTGVALIYPSTMKYQAVSPSRFLSLFDPLVNFQYTKIISQCYIDKDKNMHHKMTDPFLSPGVAPNAILECFPPTYITFGSLDPFLDEGMYLARRIAQYSKSPVTVDLIDGLGHGFLSVTGDVPMINNVMTRIEEWMKSVVTPQ